jgi:hypothetical protein
MSDFSPYLAPAVALLAAVIAWAQWHTGRSKLVLDLFNQRMEVYESVSAVMRKVMRAGTATTEDILELAGPQDRVGFLFGDDEPPLCTRLRTWWRQSLLRRSLMARSPQVSLATSRLPSGAR